MRMLEAAKRQPTLASVWQTMADGTIGDELLERGVIRVAKDLPFASQKVRKFPGSVRDPGAPVPAAFDDSGRPAGVDVRRPSRSGWRG